MRAALAEASPRAAAGAETASGDAGARAPDAPRRAILGLVSLLAEDFAAHENPNRRKGGLLGLAAVVVGLGCETGETGETGDGGEADVDAATRLGDGETRVATSEKSALKKKRLVARAALRAAVPRVLAAFRDPDARVRYYACEAMYNVVKTARGGLLLLTESFPDDDDFSENENGNDEDSDSEDSFLRRLFDAACDLSADADADVQNAAHLLDGLVKDVVSEAFHDTEENERRIQGDVLRENVKKKGSRLGACLVSAIASRANARESENAVSASRRSPTRGTRHRRVASSRDPYARQFLIGWIVALDATPQMDALRALPEFFDGLLLMLSDPNREIRAQADGCLRTFLTEIKALFDAEKGSGAAGVDARRRRVDVARLSATLERHTRSADEFTRVTAVTWLREFVALAGRAGANAGAGFEGNRTLMRNDAPSLRSHERSDGFARVAEMTRAVLPCLSHAEAKVRDVAARAAEELLEAARAAAAAGTLDLDALLSALAACAGVQTDSRAAGGTGAETPRNLDETFDAEIASPSSTLDASRETEFLNPEPILSRDPARVDAVAGEATRAEALRWYLALLETAPEETRARMLFRPSFTEDALGETRDGKRATRRTFPNGGHSLLFLSDSLASVFLNLSSASDLVTARATDALAHLGSGSDGAFDAVARALARALFEDEARAFRVSRKEASKASKASGAPPRWEIVRDAVETNGVAETVKTVIERRPTFLKRRGSATIRRMCFVLGDARVVRRIAEVVAEMAAPALRRAASAGSERDDDDDDDDDALAFAANAADALNAIALAAPECARLRRTLRGGDDAFAFAGTEDARDDGRDVGGDPFSEKESLLRGLFPCWCHSPAATIGLCLLSGLDATAYFCAEHTARDETELTRDALVRLDRLVHLFETPPFAGARLRLLAPEKNKSARPYLRRALAAVLALLPQSSAFRTLRDRLGACAPPSAGEQGGSGNEAETETLGSEHEAVSPFAARAFRAARAAHARARERDSSPTETLS